MLLLIPILSADGLFGLGCLHLKSWECDSFHPFEFTCFSPVYASSLWWKTCFFAPMQQSLMLPLAWFGPKAKPTLFFAGNRSPLPLYFLTNLQIRCLICLMLSVNKHICQNVTALHLSPSACTFLFLLPLALYAPNSPTNVEYGESFIHDKECDTALL